MQYANRNREQGSVLVVVVGLLVIMSLLATTFISAVNLNRDTASNQAMKGQARLAALSAKAHALGVIFKEASSGKTAMSGGGSEWVTVFKSVAAGDGPEDLWKYTGITASGTAPNEYYDPYPDDTDHDGKSKWFYLGFLGEGKYKNGVPPWKANKVYAKGSFIMVTSITIKYIYECTSTGGGTSGGTEPVWDITAVPGDTRAEGAITWTCSLPRAQVRYAVSIIDLHSRLLVNKTNTSPFEGPTKVQNMLTDMGMSGGNATKIAGSNAYDGSSLGSPKSFSWKHMKSVALITDTADDKYFHYLTPFGIAGKSTATLYSKVVCAININTAPKAVLAAAYTATAAGTGVSSDFAGQTYTDADTWAVRVIEARNSSSINANTDVPGYGSGGDPVVEVMLGLTPSADAGDIIGEREYYAWRGNPFWPLDGAGRFGAGSFSGENMTIAYDYGKEQQDWNMFYAGGAPPATDYAAVHLFWGQSKYFRVIVRGQVYDALRKKEIARADLEFVYCVNPNGDGSVSDSHVLYQRWITSR